MAKSKKYPHMGDIPKRGICITSLKVWNNVAKKHNADPGLGIVVIYSRTLVMRGPSHISYN